MPREDRYGHIIKVPMSQFKKKITDIKLLFFKIRKPAKNKDIKNKTQNKNKTKKIDCWSTVSAVSLY